MPTDYRQLTTDSEYAIIQYDNYEKYILIELL